MDQRPGQAQPLPHALREHRRRAFGVGQQSDGFQQRLGAILRSGHVAHPRGEDQVFAEREVRIQAALVGDHADQPAAFVFSGGLLAEPADLAACGADQRGHRAEQGRLAGPVRARQHDALALRNLQIDFVQDQAATESLGHAADFDGNAGISHGDGIS